MSSTNLRNREKNYSRKNIKTKKVWKMKKCFSQVSQNNKKYDFDILEDLYVQIRTKYYLLTEI